MQNQTGQTELILIRHGDVPENYHGRYLGSTDVCLSELGKIQAERIPRALDFFPSMVFTSPLLRTRETTASAFNGVEAKIDDNLREIDFGKWEGKTFAEVSEEFPAEAAAWASGENDFAFEDGESFTDFYNRIAAISESIRNASTPRVCFVTHGGVIRHLICRLLGIGYEHAFSFKVDYASITRLDVFGEAATLVYLNDTSHLRGIDG